MIDIYGTPITKLRRGRLLYEVSNHGQIDGCFNTQAFYEYTLVNEKGVDSGLRINMDPTSAHTFCEFNNLTLVK